MPTEEERAVILQLTGAVQDAFRVEPTTEPPTTEEPTTQATTTVKPTFPTTTKKRRKWRRRKWWGRRGAETEPIPQQLVEDEPDSDSFAPRPRQRRQSGGSLAFTMDQFLLACANQDACNPVLRASANAIIERYTTLAELSSIAI